MNATLLNQEIKTDVVVIGGGPAGMAAALSASKNGAHVLLIERDVRLGGILNQCIHNGFGLHYFKEELTGPEYAQRFAERVLADENIDVLTDAIVLSLDDKRKTLSVLSAGGLRTVSAGAIVLAMGCRERTAGAISLLGTRPAGIYTAGAAQKFINHYGKLPGKTAVILGSGDIGLIMARRLTFEGATVKLVAELMPYSSGLKRNIVQCLDDFDIPLEFSTTVTRVVGKERVEGVFVARVDANNTPIPETERFIECDTLLLSVGLIPENDLISDSGITMNAITGGAEADEWRQTSTPGVFSCGNVLHVHDLADNVSLEGEIAGASAARVARGEALPPCTVRVNGTGGVRYAMPSTLSEGEGKVTVFFRVGKVFKNAKLIVTSGKTVIAKKAALIFTPGEMESVSIDKSKLCGDVTLRIEEGEQR